MFECFTVAAETKVLPTVRPAPVETYSVMASDETLSFQAAYYSEERILDVDVRVTVNGKPSDKVLWRVVEYVSCTTPIGGAYDNYYISHEPFVCPDVLRPADKRKPYAHRCQWRAIWLTVRGLAPGAHAIEIVFHTAKGEKLGDCKYSVVVKDCKIGKSDLIYTNWFHYDGLAQYYRLPVFSDEYNTIMYRYIDCAVAHGMNMLLIPMFTPALDTRIGTERLTVQLVDVTVKTGKYSFSFDRLLAFMKAVQARGIEYFEMAHLFTQWGATAAPKIMATVDGEYKRIFGWDTPAVGGEYERFLHVFLPALKQVLTEAGLLELCYFHISDEPNDQNIEQYSAARAVFRSCLPDVKVMDAISHYEFYERGLVDMAVAATTDIQPFLDHKVPDLWAYYCCCQTGNYLSNRLMAMPGERTRVIGFQLFLNNIVGFLHWGYNFYNSSYSDEPVDPFAVTDAGGHFQSGDSFIVYPGATGPLDSLRHELMMAAWQDVALMQRLAEKKGRAAAEKMLLDHGFAKNFTDYPRDLGTLKQIRERALIALAERNGE